MANTLIPDGFDVHWDGTTLFVRLPPAVETDSHTLTPVLSSADARALAAVAAAGEVGPAHRVVLLVQPGYETASIERFRERLVSFLDERGVRANVDWTVASSLDAEAPAELEPLEPEAPSPEASSPLDLLLLDPPPATPSDVSPSPAPTPPSPPPTRSPAPTPTRRRLRERGGGTEPRAHPA